MSAVLIKCWEGLGDNVYLRPMVRAAVDAGEDVYLKTPWPQLFQDLDVRFVEPDAQYRTQGKNAAARPASTWTEPPADARVFEPSLSKKSPSITGVTSRRRSSPQYEAQPPCRARSAPAAC